MPYLHAESLSPDPLYGRTGRRRKDGFYGLKVHPHGLVRVGHSGRSIRNWATGLEMSAWTRPLQLRAGSGGRVDLVLDFGTELEGELELALDAHSRCDLYVTFGESVPEAEGWGVPGQHPSPTEHWHLPRRGVNRHTFGPRGFRFVRILAHDVGGTLTLREAVVHARFAFREQLGDLRCSDRRFQRVWQASVYTARLNARTDAYWDGVKRDRHGWYGDARITQETCDCTFHDPVPAEQMLLKLPTDSWANAIPTYSFDAVAMLRQSILAHGLDRPALEDIYARVRALLDWARRTQTSEEGLLTRRDEVDYFFGIGFLDWTPTPVGGTFEELSWLQFKYLEALRDAARIAGWLGHRAEAGRFGEQADALAAAVRDRYWRRSRGFVHTLNLAERQWQTLADGVHYRRTYVDGVRLGPSGPSRHSSALAVWAGLCDDARRKAAVLKVLDNPKVQEVITGYFAYYEQIARAECGDPVGAIMHMRDYVGDQLEQHDSATVWESYEPQVHGFRAWGLASTWSKSLCHGWSSGAVPIGQRYLLGIWPVEPAFGRVALRPPVDLPWTFEATVPTPHGPIRVERASRGGSVSYILPPGVEAAGAVPEGVEVHFG